MRIASWRACSTALWLAASVALCGCASVRVDTNSGSVETRGLLGARQALPIDGIVAVRTEGLGVFRSASSVSVGFVSSTSVYLPPASQCTVLLLKPDPEQVAHLTTLLKDSGINPASICTDEKEME